MTRAADAELAARLGAWAIGFIFHDASPRATTPDSAGGIIRTVRAPELKTVGVFVNASLEAIVRAVERSGINTVQLHGEEGPGFCAELKERLPQVGVIKALRPRGRDELAQVPLYGTSCEAVLLDAYVSGVPGGTGLTGDWSLAAEAAKTARIILAGGLNPGNIRKATQTAGVFAVDASSGLEEAPGVKSSEKMKLFFENAMSSEGPA